MQVLGVASPGSRGGRDRRYNAPQVYGQGQQRDTQSKQAGSYPQGINPACFHVGLMAAQGRAAVGHQADARPHHTSRSAHLRQRGADDNQIDQDELFDCHVNSATDGQISQQPQNEFGAPSTYNDFDDEIPCALAGSASNRVAKPPTGAANTGFIPQPPRPASLMRYPEWREHRIIPRLAVQARN
ncbi:hypothetical protein SAMN05660971_03804 [Halomonas cupida]|uniref:Uncharacterized protein n=2 Tax=Halomonas cupida TaxID=44933 RepID=A0A1M7LD63_9GAMM|nr:hypothetical protein SAMN05660971_03804 [Halomonas cupida]